MSFFLRFLIRTEVMSSGSNILLVKGYQFVMLCMPLAVHTRLRGQSLVSWRRFSKEEPIPACVSWYVALPEDISRLPRNLGENKVCIQGWNPRINSIKFEKEASKRQGFCSVLFQDIVNLVCLCFRGGP